jgi:succinate dehydrogenase/fumarate reductase flavoprotein subunit
MTFETYSSAFDSLPPVVRRPKPTSVSAPSPTAAVAGPAVTSEAAAPVIERRGEKKIKVTEKEWNEIHSERDDLKKKVTEKDNQIKEKDNQIMQKNKAIMDSNTVAAQAMGRADAFQSSLQMHVRPGVVDKAPVRQ